MKRNHRIGETSLGGRAGSSRASMSAPPRSQYTNSGCHSVERPSPRHQMIDVSPAPRNPEIDALKR